MDQQPLATLLDQRKQDLKPIEQTLNTLITALNSNNLIRNEDSTALQACSNQLEIRRQAVEDQSNKAINKLGKHLDIIQFKYPRWSLKECEYYCEINHLPQDKRPRKIGNCWYDRRDSRPEAHRNPAWPEVLATPTVMGFSGYQGNKKNGIPILASIPGQIGNPGRPPIYENPERGLAWPPIEYNDKLGQTVPIIKEEDKLIHYQDRDRKLINWKVSINYLRLYGEENGFTEESYLMFFERVICRERDFKEWLGFNGKSAN